MLTVSVDGRYSQDVVLFAGAQRFTYDVALGQLARGRHRVTVAFDRAKSPPGARGAKVTKLAPSLAARDDLAARYAPILYGRDLPEIPGRYENNSTDVPLLEYHTTATGADGTTTIEYTMIWSNEDGGTNTPALMARWGRTTDIEWIYRVVLDPAGRIVSEHYQAPNHETKAFSGAKEGLHPLLVNVTSNNNLEQVTDPAASTGYRFFLSGTDTLPAGRAREAVMDANPWTYRVTAQEIAREGELEPVASPDTPAVSDQRNYVFAEVDKDTSYPAPPASGTWVGTALAVKLRGGDRWYTSHHDVPDWSIQRDDPAATTVELPPGATSADVEAIKAVAVPVAKTSAAGARAVRLHDPRAAAQPRLPARRGLPPAAVVPAVERRRRAHAAAARGGDLAGAVTLSRRRDDRASDLVHDVAERRQGGIGGAGAPRQVRSDPPPECSAPEDVLVSMGLRGA